jgi:hypothetical protein
MSIHRVQNIFIGDGANSAAAETAGNYANGTNIVAGDITVIGADNKVLAGGATIANTDTIFIVQGLADGTLKRSMAIKGLEVSSYTSEPYRASNRKTMAIGYDRKLATGSIEVNDDTDYDFYVTIKTDKQLYSERFYKRTYSFRSALSATQLSIATQAALAITNDGSASGVTAIVVGDGTGLYGLTGATNYGVEITSKNATNFVTQYMYEKIDFTLGVDSSGGFGATTVTTIQTFDRGNGTPKQIYDIENFDFGYEGVINRRLFPVPVLTYSTSTTLVSTTIAETATGTSGEDTVTFSATVASVLKAGDIIGTTAGSYEIKYFISSTVAVLTSVLTGALVASAVTLGVGYDMIVIEFGNTTFGQGADVVADSRQSVVIAVPAGTAATSSGTASAQGTYLIGKLNTYMATTPKRFPAVTL